MDATHCRVWLILSTYTAMSVLKIGVFQLQIDVAKASLCLKKFSSRRTFNGEFEEANFFPEMLPHMLQLLLFLYT